MESKLLNLVEFKFLRNSYPVNENVLCYFGTTTNPGTHVPQVGDWVGLFKVGWKHLNEYKVRKFVSVESIESSRRSQTEYTHVVFEQMHLPKEVEGYHQFVYVAKGEVVRGVSRPFEFECERKNMKQELKEIKREMWNNVEEREMWGKMLEQEKRELIEREREREIREREREQRERSRECEQRERERSREREVQREREIREVREREIREVREQREREVREREREIREREERERSRERRERSREERERSREQRERSHERKQRERELRELCERERENGLRYEINNNNTKVMESLEGDLLEKLCHVKFGGEETVVGKLLQKYLNCVRSKKDEDFSKRFEELFVENNKLSLSLRSRISEVADLKKECEELRLINNELVNKISKGEKKVEHLERELERERETVRRHIEEREILPELTGKNYLEKVASDLDETKIMLKEENERLRDELRRLSVLYQTESGLKNKWLKIDELNKRLGEKCMSEIEKSTFIEMKGLKKLVEELRCENETLKSRMRFDIETRKPEMTVQYPVTSKTTIIKEKSSTHMPKVNSQPEYLSLIETRPIGQEYPSISVSTSIPEISSKTSVTVSGKVSGPITEQTVRGSLNGVCLGKVERSIEEQVRTRSIAEHLRHELERLNGKLSDIREVKEQLTNDKCVEVVLGKEGKLPCWLVTPSSEDLIQKQIQRQQQKQFLKHYEEQTKQLKEQLTPLKEQLSSICPVCGIAVSKELNQTELELHVNSHFTD